MGDERIRRTHQVATPTRIEGGVTDPVEPDVLGELAGTLAGAYRPEELDGLREEWERPPAVGDR